MGRSKSVPPGVIGQHKGPGQLGKGNVTLRVQAAERVGESGLCLGRRYLVGDIQSLGGGVVPAVAEAIAVSVHLQDVDVVGETVQQRAGEALRAEDFGPLVEWQIGGDQD